MDGDVKIRARRGSWDDRVEILIKGGRSYVGVLRFELQEEGTMTIPTLSCTKDVAQVLMDDLWDAGLRPSEGSGSAGSLRATEKHLQDMRDIVFYKVLGQTPAYTISPKNYIKTVIKEEK